MCAEFLIRFYYFLVKWKRTLEPKYLLFILALLLFHSNCSFRFLFSAYLLYPSQTCIRFWFVLFSAFSQFKYLIKWFLCQIKDALDTTTSYIKQRRDNNILVKELHFWAVQCIANTWDLQAQFEDALNEPEYFSSFLFISSPIELLTSHIWVEHIKQHAF